MEELGSLDMGEIKKDITPKKPVKTGKAVTKKKPENEEGMICCLRNERVIIRHIPKENSNITNPKHILYGGMAENAVKYFSVPLLQSGGYMNILTNSEKEYLEDIMGLEYNALSIYKKENNYWENRMVRLTKADNYLDLSDPEQYISYKILLANKNFIAPSLKELEDRPKATYQFVIIAENEETKVARKEMSATMQAYMEFGKIQDEGDMLKLVIELLEGRPLSPYTKIEVLQTKINKLIQSSPRNFLKVVTDSLLPTKLLIKKGTDAGIISNRNGLYYMRKDGAQLCNNGDDPTLSSAANFLNQPQHSELRFYIEGQLKESEK